MNKEIKDKWVTALRSGAYKQGTGMLQSPQNKYYCFGVLAEVAETPFENGLYDFDGNRCRYNPPINFCRKIDIFEDSVSIAIKMNDRDNKSFNEIADWIEANL